MSTRRAVALLFGLSALLAPAAARGQAITAGLGGGTSSLVSQPFDVPVIVDMTARPERVGAFALRIQWNPAVLQFQIGMPGSFGDVTANQDSVAQGIIKLAGANPAGAAGLITLGVGRFVPLKADTTTLLLTFSQLYAAGTFADLRPSLSVSNGQFCAAAGRYGDIDGDGVSNSRDALIALESAVGLDVSAYPIALGDVTGDGVTNTRDALVMLSAGVGIDVSGFPRLGQVSGGACAPGVPVTMAITPVAATGVLVGQEVAFEARAVGPTGALVTIPGAIFRSSNPSVLAFTSPSGPSTAEALAPGTVTVTAVRDAKDSVQTTVTVVARRTTHWVDAKAAGAPNQLGTQTLPFATIGAALQVAQGGDTVRPQPGRYEESLVVSGAIVLMGDTLPDGTRPVIAGQGTGILLSGTGSREVHYLELDDFANAIDIQGPSHVLLRGIRARNVVYGVLAAESPVGQLRIESSRFSGGTALAEVGAAVNVGSVDTLVVQGTEISDFANYGVHTSGTDSLAVLGSSIHDIGLYAIDAEPSAPMAFVLDSSAVSSSYQAVWLSPIRSAAFTHTRFTGGGFGVTVSGNGAGWVRFQHDSMDAGDGGGQWLAAARLDSLVMDSIWVRNPSGYGSTMDVPLIRVTNSRFVDLGGAALEVLFAAGGGGRVALDNVAVTGDPRCDVCATAFSLTSATTTANNVAGTNLSEMFSTSGDSSLTVTNAVFQHVSVPISWSASDTGTTARVTVRNSQFLGFDTGVYASQGALTVDSNTFQASQGYAVQAYGPEGSLRIVGNTVSGVANAFNVSAFNRPVAVAITDNVITDLSANGIQAEGGADSLNSTFQILRNSLACNAKGTTSGEGILLSSAHSVIASNQVLGCYSGISVSASGSATAVPRVDSVVGNTVTLPSFPYFGLYVSGAVQARIAGNSVTADTTGGFFGDIWVTGATTSGGPVTAAIDSNVVSGGSYTGIYVADVDSAAVRFNTVQGVASANCIGCGEGGISVDGAVPGAASVYGNLVRNVRGIGINGTNSDTALVVVDSNLVAGNTYGMSLGQGNWQGSYHVTRNRITNNTTPVGGYGIYIYYADTLRTLVDSNNIVGNRFGLYATANGYHVPNNWWGDPVGPSCPEPCSGGSTGDSMTATLAYLPVLTAPMPSGLPLNVPPAMLAGAVRPAAARLVSRSAVTPVVRGFAGSPRLAVRVTAPRLAARAPARLGAAKAAALQVQIDRLAAAVAARTGEQAAGVAGMTTRAAERRAWLQGQVRAAGQRDSLRTAQMAAQVAAQQALHARQR